MVVLCRTAHAHFREMVLIEEGPWMPTPEDAVAKRREIRGPRRALIPTNYAARTPVSPGVRAGGSFKNGVPSGMMVRPKVPFVTSANDA